MFSVGSRKPSDLSAWTSRAVSCRHEFQCLGPVLLVVPDDMLALWEGEFAFWAGAHVMIRSVPGA